MNIFLICCCCFLPLKHMYLTSPYGYRIHPVTGQYRFHQGIDLRANHDTVFAIASGTAQIGYNNLLGIYIKISDGNLTCTYGHLSQLFISAGPVICGLPIAITGTTGRVTGEHLHLSISYKTQSLNPLYFLFKSIKNHEQQFKTP